MSPWLLLIVAGIFEVVWASTLKRTDGFSKLWPSVITLAAMSVSFYLLARAMQSLPAGVSYAVWVGIGAVGTLLVGWLALGERLAPAQWVCLGVVIAGLVGLKALTPVEPKPPAAVPTVGSEGDRADESHQAPG